MNKKLEARDKQRARRAARAGEFGIVEMADGTVVGDGASLATLPATGSETPQAEAAAAGPAGYDEAPTGEALEHIDATASGAEGETAQELVQEVVDAEAEASEWLHDEPNLDVLAAGDETVVEPSEPHPVVVIEEPLPEATPEEAAAEAAETAEVLESLDANEVPVAEVAEDLTFLDDGEDLDGAELSDLDTLLTEIDGAQSLRADATVGEAIEAANDANETALEDDSPAG